MAIGLNTLLSKIGLQLISLAGVIDMFCVVIQSNLESSASFEFENKLYWVMFVRPGLEHLMPMLERD